MATPEALEFAESVPQAAPLQPVPESVQITPLFCESFCTVAVNGCVVLTATEAVDGATLTEIGPPTAGGTQKRCCESRPSAGSLRRPAWGERAGGAVHDVSQPFSVRGFP